MSKLFKRGLVVGKFSPLHLGHELVINAARQACEQVYVISYSKPEFACCPRGLREHWITQGFPDVIALVLDDAYLAQRCRAKNISTWPAIPDNDAADEEQRIFVGWLCLYILEITVDAVFTSEDYGDGFAEVLSQYFQQHTGQSTKVNHVCVDKPRAAINISATQIRAAIHQHTPFLSPSVSGSLVQRVCLLGGESTGKTTLAQMLANEYDTLWVPEYGRELWMEKASALEFVDMLRIAQTQVDRENQLVADAKDWLFCDTSPLTTLFYSQALFDNADEQLHALATRHYDQVFVCVPDFALVQDGTRQDESFRLRQHAWYLDVLNKSAVPYTLLSGDVRNRLASVKAVLAESSRVVTPVV